MPEIDAILKSVVDDYVRIQRIVDDQTVIIFDKSRSYINAVVTVGYASFFAIWGFTKDSIPEKVSTHVAIAMGISILLFVLFVVVDMLFITYVTVKFNNNVRFNINFKTVSEAIAHSQEYGNKVDIFQRDIKRASLSIIIIWPFFFVPSLLSGLYASILLLYNFLAKLVVCLPYWPV
ncbi:hypothetical protein [Shumkonia mesophila]|uniref:hypothetical protein n=1 Tax=Shumkonia mesophila TaxID=2838854 RepID=UPI002934C825|nr:hypothetical protein [Shumkonia mesophila]